MNKGFTLIELIIVIAIIGIIASIVVPIILGVGNPHVSWTSAGGPQEEVCRGGYKFLVSHYQTQQIFNENGGGVPCE